MSCADVCVTMEYDQSNEFYRETMPRARKTYRCCECGDVIAVGDVHQYATGKSDGCFWDYRTCTACVEIRKAFVCGSWVFGELWEQIRDQLFCDWNEMTAIDCLAKLTTPAAIEKMRACYAQYVEDQR